MERLEINKLVKKLNEEFFKSTGNRWVNITVIFNNVGKFEVRYIYDDVNNIGLMKRRKN